MKQSLGEVRICQILTQNNIKFQCEKTFCDLRGGHYRFDFYLLWCGRKIVIEFNGEQHYKFTRRFFNTQKEWLAARERDRRKISYCLANDIEIYEIPFWELDYLNTMEGLLADKFRARSRWHNDEVYTKYINDHAKI